CWARAGCAANPTKITVGTATQTFNPNRALMLVHDRLVDELLHQLAEVGALRARGLGHQHRGELLLRIDPEVRSGVAGPHELARGTRNAADAIALAHGEAQAERVALGAKKQLTRLHRLVDESAEVIRSHEAHRGAAEDPVTFERAAVQQHLREAQVVAGGG